MADSVTVDNGGLTDYVVSSDEGAGGHVQRVKLAYSADGSETHVQTDADGVLVNLGANNDVTIPGLTQTQDAAYSPGSLLMAGGVRRDADTTPVSADNDVHPLVFDELGRLKISSYSPSIAAYTDTITANADTVSLDVSRYSNLVIYCTGTFSTVNCAFEASLDGTNWFGVQAVRTNANTIETSTGNLSAAPAYAWELSVNAYSNFRVRATAFTSGTQTWRFQPGAYATEPIPAAQVTGTQAVSGTVTASGTVGVAAEDAALSGNPVGVGVRAHSIVPTAMSADNDVVRPWADRSGALVVIPQPRILRVTATPTISTSGYVTNDQVGGAMTFASMQLAAARWGSIISATLTCRTLAATNDLELWLFATSATIASSDNAAWSITDANLEASAFVGVIDFDTANYRATADGAVCMGTYLGGVPNLPYNNAGGTSLVGYLVMRSASPTQYGGATDLQVWLHSNLF